MELLINSDKVEISNHVDNVTLLLKHFKLDRQIVIVEVNGNILDKMDHQNTRLSDGDKIEIVHFVGGG